MQQRITQAALNLRRLRDQKGALRVQVGAERGDGAMQWQIPLGKVPPEVAGEFGSDMRRAWELEVARQVGRTIVDVVQPYIAHSVPAERRAFVGCALSYQGTVRALISVTAHRLPLRVEAQLADILGQEISASPAAGRGGAAFPLTAFMRPGCEPEGCVTVTLKGPTLPVQQGAVAAILEGVGYKKGEV
jgi:hypothetical protein